MSNARLKSSLLNSYVAGMITNQETIDEFKSIYKEEFGVEITDREAEDKFNRLLNVLGTLFKYTEEKEFIHD